jgi:hypothetical protein
MMNEQHDNNLNSNKQATLQVERFLEATYSKLPVDSKVLVALFAALNTGSTLAGDFELPNQLWREIRFDGCGPLVGQSEEVNWLKGVCDGILLLADHT